MIGSPPSTAAARAALLVLFAAPSAVANDPHEPRAVRYDRDIRPLLSNRCFTCHGPDEAKRKAKLRLDRADGAYAERSGVAAIVPGDPEASEVWARVTDDDDDWRMPPPDSNKRALSDDELALLEQWIKDGAVYEDHWSFVAPARSSVPSVQNPEWVRNEVDSFILATLEARNLAPNPEASPESLVRRVFLELTGLPPTPEEIEAFLADEGEDRYERLVDRLLTEEPYVSRYAERMAVPWLDAARYADTSGIHMDAGRQIWPWRDWLLRSLRDGMPFDQFVTEQIAGDLLPNATLDQRIASGFNRNHVTTDEGGAINAEYLVEYAVDRTSTTGSVFLALTLGCARCHDHKYDPVSQEEFYRLFAFFNSNEEPGLYSQSRDPNRALEPFIRVPSPSKEVELSRIEAALTEAREALERPEPGEDEARAAFFADVADRAGVLWAPARITGVESTGPSTLDVLDDSSILASGENPGVDTHLITLETEATFLRLVALEALPHESLPHPQRVGRAPNGNAVLESIRAEAISLRDPSRREDVRFTWAWADVEQMNGDYRAVNALADDRLGWAVDGHSQDGPRAALFLAEKPFGFPGGTRVVVQLDYDTGFGQHVFGRTRVTLGRVAPSGFDTLGIASSGWYATAPFRPADGEDVFDAAFGPESLAALDTTTTFGSEELKFNYVQQFRDDRLNGELGGGVGATYVAKRLYVPSARDVEVSIGSDDGFRIFLDGEEVAKRRVNRGVAKNQDRVTLSLDAGVHTVTMKVVNTGGPAGFYWKTLRRENELTGRLLSTFLPDAARGGDDELLRTAWREEFSPNYRVKRDREAALEDELEAAEADIPRTMVMKELAAPRDTFVLMRGEYDKPDTSRKVSRAVPAALGELPADVPRDRRGLAAWMTSADNPLVARVAVNRLWELCFGSGLVATSEDFGMQGEWPSHPELLDWLAVEYRESGWDTKALVKKIVTSSTYRQSSRSRPELTAIDPDDRLLARYPRRRLEAEQIRDQVLYVSGLLVERFGGASVKPYQPDGLWREVAMLQSNTRNFERGSGEELWRRSLYTYWKRASPPPAMLTFDAPTREFCTIRRGETATPLQALVLWNDEQFVEAARKLAERTLVDDSGADSDAARLARMFVRCTGRKPDANESVALERALDDFRGRYHDAPDDAQKLLDVGEAPVTSDVAPAELAAWTMIANALFSLDAMIVRG